MGLVVLSPEQLTDLSEWILTNSGDDDYGDEINSFLSYTRHALILGRKVKGGAELAIDLAFRLGIIVGQDAAGAREAIRKMANVGEI